MAGETGTNKPNNVFEKYLDEKEQNSNLEFQTKEESIKEVPTKEIKESKVEETENAETKEDTKVVSLGRSEKLIREEQRKFEESSGLDGKLGWMPIETEGFPSRGMFYPSDARFLIKSADSKVIRHFSTMNEEDPYSVDECLTDILTNCLKVQFPDRIGSYKDLKEEDRIFVILAIKELTFPKGENRLAYTQVCFDCDHPNEIEVRKDIFTRREINENIAKYYSEEERIFVVKTKNHGDIRITPPTIGVMKEVTKYIKQKQVERRKISMDFLNMLPYMVTDWRGFNDKTIKNLELEYMRWDDTKYGIMYKLVDWAKVSVSENITIPCSKCGAEVTAPVQFPGGLKNLFVISDISGELL